MSGSGGGGGGGGSGGGDGISCEQLRFDAQINSPQAAVVQTLAVGEVLTVAIATVAGTQALQVLKGTARVGGLIGGLAAKLRECILGGTSYDAAVKSISSGQVWVHIEPT